MSERSTLARHLPLASIRQGDLILSASSGSAGRPVRLVEHFSTGMTRLTVTKRPGSDHLEWIDAPSDVYLLVLK